MEIIVHMFERTLVTSLESALMVCLLLLIMAVFRKKLTPFWKYALWMLLIVKLLLSWLPANAEINFHWIRLPDMIGTHISSNEYVELQNQHKLPVEQIDNLAPWIESNLSNYDPMITTIETVTSETSSIVVQIAAIVWLLGAIVTLLYMIIGIVKMSLAVKKEDRVPIPSELQNLFNQICKQSRIRTNVSLRITNKVASPTLFGMISPIVLIPRNLVEGLGLDLTEWECVLRHEVVHLKRFDVWVNMIFFILTAIHWFNPLIWYSMRRMRFEQETACDASVLASLQTKDIYAGCIVKVLEIGASQRVASVGIGFSDYKNQVVRRIVMIRNFNPKKKRVSLFGMIILVAFALLTLPSAFAKEGMEEGKYVKSPEPIDQMTIYKEDVQLVMDSPLDQISTDISFIMPTSGRVSSVFGYRTDPIAKVESLHDGMDIVNIEGTDVYAAATGYIVRAEYDSEYGYTVVIKHNESLSTEYRHLKKLLVNQGEEVTSEDVIGLIGHTGRASGPHLHFSILRDGNYIDPMSFITDTEFYN